LLHASSAGRFTQRKHWKTVSNLFCFVFHCILIFAECAFVNKVAPKFVLLRAIINLTPRGEICPPGVMFIPSFPPRGEHSLLFRRMEGRAENFTPRAQNSPPGDNFAPGVRVCA
jgi:hypothetical protein